MIFVVFIDEQLEYCIQIHKLKCSYLLDYTI